MIDRNDRIFLYALGIVLLALVLVAYAPAMGAQSSIVKNIWALLNSNFFTALAGAFAGALGAQFIFERTSKQKNLLAEIRELNAALSIAADIGNAYLVFKKQIVHKICGDYERLRSSILDPARGQSSATLDLRMFKAPFSPIEALQRSVQERVRPDGASLSFLTSLTQATRELENALAARNELIKSFRKISPENYSLLVAMYFGNPLGPMVDGSYPSHMKAIADLTDDCIGISILLVRLLRAYGKRIAKQYGSSAPKIAKFEWDIPEGREFVPSLARYEEWLTRSFTVESEFYE